MSFDFPARLEGYRSGIGGSQGADHRAAGEPLIFLPLAHALVGKKDLPIPAWLFAWGASLVLIVSFFRSPTPGTRAASRTDTWRPVSERISRLVVNRVTETILGLLQCLLLGVGIWSGLYGVGTPDLNFALTFFFVTVWLGLVLLSVCFGDVFRALSPWRAIARGFSAFLRLLAGRTPKPPFPYPERFGRWPAAGVIVAFVWLELVYGLQGFQAVGVEPRTAAIAALVYSVYALAGWRSSGSSRGSTAARASRRTSRCSPSSRRWRCATAGSAAAGRSPGLPSWAMVPGSVALIVATIGGTTFDGAQEGTLASPINSVGQRLLDIGFGTTWAVRVDETIFLALTLAFVAGIYWLGVKGMHLVRSSPPTRELGLTFGHTLIPIGLAYLTAHYFSLVFFQEQAQFTYLLTDPLGHCEATCGAAASPINFGAIERDRGLVRAGRGARRGPRDGADAGPRQGDNRLQGLAAGGALAAVDAAGDGRLHLPRALPALIVKRVTKWRVSSQSSCRWPRRSLALAPLRAAGPDRCLLDCENDDERAPGGSEGARGGRGRREKSGSERRAPMPKSERPPR